MLRLARTLTSCARRPPRLLTLQPFLLRPLSSAATLSKAAVQPARAPVRAGSSSSTPGAGDATANATAAGDAPVVTTCDLESAATDPLSNPGLASRLEDYIIEPERLKNMAQRLIGPQRRGAGAA